MNQKGVHSEKGCGTLSLLLFVVETKPNHSTAINA